MIKVRIDRKDGTTVNLDAEKVVSDGSGLQVETNDRRSVRFPFDGLVGWAVRKADGPWDRHAVGGV